MKRLHDPRFARVNASRRVVAGSLVVAGSQLLTSSVRDSEKDSGNDLVDHVTVNIGQSAVNSIVPHGQLFVIDPQ